MDRNVMAKYLHHLELRLNSAEDKLTTLFKVLQEIVGKELMRGQALHKVLMDKGLFTDTDLKGALEKIMEESKAELKKAEEDVKAEKQKAVEILVPAGANLTPPSDPTPEAPATPPEAASGSL